jgi:hypothetical protein
MAAPHEFSAPPSVAVTQGNNIQIEYFGEGVVVMTKADEATDWVHIPITVPRRLNGKNTKLNNVKILFPALTNNGADKVRNIRVWVGDKNINEDDHPSLPKGTTSKEYDISSPPSIGLSGVIISVLVNIKRPDSVLLNGASATLLDA